MLRLSRVLMSLVMCNPKYFLVDLTGIAVDGVNHGFHRRSPLRRNLWKDTSDDVSNVFVIFFFQAMNFEILAPLVSLQLSHFFFQFHIFFNEPGGFPFPLIAF